MINLNKLSGITDNVATAIKKAQNGMRAAMPQKPDAASAKKLAGSLDGLAAQNKATTKAELVKLGKLRQRLMKSYIQPEHLDNATLRKIEKEAEKIKGMNFDELKKYGCSPTELPEVSAAKKLIAEPYTNSRSILQTKADQVRGWMNNRDLDITQFDDKTINKIAKKTQEYETNMLKQAAKRGMAPTGDPLGAALKKVTGEYEPHKFKKVTDAASTGTRISKGIQFETVTINQPFYNKEAGKMQDNFVEVRKAIQEPRYAPGGYVRDFSQGPFTSPTIPTSI